MNEIKPTLENTNECIAEWRDRLSALWHASTLPVPAACLADGINKIHDEMTMHLAVYGRKD